MQYIHVKSLEHYHPGYKDRKLQWAKIYFDMVQGDPDCEMIDNEVDWGRLIKLIILELRAQRPIPINSRYLTNNGFDLKKRPIELTLKMLHNFIEVVTEEEETCVLDKDKEEDKDKSRVNEIVDYLNSVCNTSFRSTTKATESHISARIRDGFTVEDFKAVIDHKQREWGNNKEMGQYLRPITLFGTKFESYLEASKKDAKPDLDYRPPSGAPKV